MDSSLQGNEQDASSLEGFVSVDRQLSFVDLRSPVIVEEFNEQMARVARWIAKNAGAEGKINRPVQKLLLKLITDVQFDVVQTSDKIYNLGMNSNRGTAHLIFRLRKPNSPDSKADLFYDPSTLKDYVRAPQKGHVSFPETSNGLPYIPHPDGPIPLLLSQTTLKSMKTVLSKRLLKAYEEGLTTIYKNAAPPRVERERDIIAANEDEWTRAVDDDDKNYVRAKRTTKPKKAKTPKKKDAPPAVIAPSIESPQTVSASESATSPDASTGDFGEAMLRALAEKAAYKKSGTYKMKNRQRAEEAVRAALSSAKLRPLSKEEHLTALFRAAVDEIGLWRAAQRGVNKAYRSLSEQRAALFANMPSMKIAYNNIGNDANAERKLLKLCKKEITARQRDLSQGTSQQDSSLVIGRLQNMSVIIETTRHRLKDKELKSETANNAKDNFEKTFLAFNLAINAIAPNKNKQGWLEKLEKLEEESDAIISDAKKFRRESDKIAGKKSNEIAPRPKTKPSKQDSRSFVPKPSKNNDESLTPERRRATNDPRPHLAKLEPRRRWDERLTERRLRQELQKQAQP